MILVEREHQLTALGRLTTAAIGGQGRIAAVRGPVGTGKTALLRACARNARERGAQVLESSASRLEQPLALGVLDQLFHSATLPVSLSDDVRELLNHGAAMSYRTALGAPVAEEATAHMLHDLCRALLAVAAQRPLVIIVDDAHHADALSVRCLSYMAARIERSPVLLVYSESDAPASGPAFPADLADRANWQRIDLAPLSAHGTWQALAELAADLPAGTEAAAHRLTGGNPVLLHALADDGRLATLTTDPQPAGDTAMRRFLRRLSPAERTVANGLAVLGPDAPAGLLGRLVDTDPDTVAVANRTLTAAGVLVDGWFRDPALAATALAELPPAERAALRVSAAALLRDVNAAPIVVARQLVAVADLHDGTHGRVPAWAVPVLGRAASQSEQAGDLPFAVRCLRSALEVAEGDAERARCRAALARAEWRVDPTLAMRHLPELTEAIHADLLDHRQALPPINWLVWFGQVDRAVDLMAHLNRRIVSDPADAQRMRSTRLWLAWLYPTRARQAWGVPGGQHENNTALTLDPMLHAARLFTEALAAGASDRLVAEVEKILHGSDVHERTLQMVVALAALVYGERLDAAAAWCDVLVHNAESKGAPTQQAIFTAVRAEIAVRQGDMPHAEQWARTALELVPAASWGVAVGFPLASLLRACTAMGRHRQAVECLRVPVPDAMFQTVIGVHYLRARSLFFQATGRHSAALLDCRSCGELLAGWGMEAPAFTPWRSDTAVSCLWLGRQEEARSLAEEQLALTEPAQQRTRGISLRALAATYPPADRVPLLEQAVTALRACGDRLELAQALVDLADAHRRAGRPARAAQAEAAELSTACGVPTPTPTGPDQSPERARLDLAGPQRTPAPRPAEHVRSALDRLSEAELRVAELAAAGHTNRQIADQLFVTVSTVEQHLTKTYRKLRVSRRTQLSSALSAGLSPRTRDALCVRLQVSRPAAVPGSRER
jgi:DNA-binding CsgD family transcriptional regulator